MEDCNLKFCMNCCYVKGEPHARLPPACLRGYGTHAWLSIYKETIPLIIAKLLACTSKGGVKLLDKLIKKISD
jgi:hypothetical protein